jgi:hypothetical protein
MSRLVDLGGRAGIAVRGNTPCPTKLLVDRPRRYPPRRAKIPLYLLYRTQSPLHSFWFFPSTSTMASYQPYGSPQAPNLYPSYPPSINTHSSSFEGMKAAEDGRQLSRTPSPTPSEERELRTTGPFDWKAMSQPKFWIRREWLCACYHLLVH